MILSRQQIFKTLVLTTIFIGVFVRLFVAWRFQSRAWIDEVWVLLNPAYHLLTGTGYLNPQDWGAPSPRGIRSWMAPGLLFFYLKFLSILGIKKGTIVLPIVRMTLAAISSTALIAFAFSLGRALKLKAGPLLPLVTLLFVPQLIHYGALHDLSVVGLPVLLFAFVLIECGQGVVTNTRFRTAAVLLGLCCILRFQYFVFALIYFGWLSYKRQWRRALELFLVGIIFLVIDAGINTWMYGRPILPAFNFFIGNAFYGMGNDAGTMPFGAGLEFLWRYVTEPVFALVFITALLSQRRLPFLTLAAFGFYGIHLMLSHKEFRYFYTPAVLLTGLASSSFQAWLEENWATRKKSSQAALTVFCILFVSFATWRALKKTSWQDYAIPSRLETLAGAQPDIRGLLVAGWGGGIYCGGQYNFYQPLPYYCGSTAQYFNEMHADPKDFNYIIRPENEPAPCAQIVEQQGGGTLYRCTTFEIRRLLSEE